MNEERKSLKENSLETKQTDFRKREDKQAGNNRNDNLRGYRQSVRHGTYGRGQVNNPTSTYNRSVTSCLGQNYSGRTEDSTPKGDN